MVQGKAALPGLRAVGTTEGISREADSAGAQDLYGVQHGLKDKDEYGGLSQASVAMESDMMEASTSAGDRGGKRVGHDLVMRGVNRS